MKEKCTDDQSVSSSSDYEMTVGDEGNTLITVGDKRDNDANELSNDKTPSVGIVGGDTTVINAVGDHDSLAERDGTDSAEDYMLPSFVIFMFHSPFFTPDKLLMLLVTD